MKDLNGVCKFLNEIDQQGLVQLGVALGLNYPKITRMKVLPEDMVASWLRREDDVLTTSGEPTWENLVNTLESKGQMGIAKSIRQKMGIDQIDLVQNGRNENSNFIKYLLSFSILILALMAMPIIYYHFPTILYYLNLYHSKTLPYPFENFVGREEDLKQVVQLLDFQNDPVVSADTRIVSLIGSPGFGKSTLAIHVGHEMVKQGVNVHYVDVSDFPDGQSVKQILAEKVIESSHIFSKSINFNRLLRWAREHYQNSLLMLDNCDKVLHDQREEFQIALQRLVESSRQVKILVTSRREVVVDPYSKTYSVHELTSKASQQLLEYREHTGIKLTLEQKMQIANLTGNIPLALHIMKSLLDRVGSPSSSQLISELEKEPIETLSPKDFQSERQIKATLDLSFRYLDQQWRVVACQLTLFPGSFAEDAAVFVFSNGSKSDDHRKGIRESLQYLVRHSLLSHDQRKNRYQYHQLIMKYLVHIQREMQSGSQTQYCPFYYVYYANLLITAYAEFRKKFELSIAIVNSDRHNFHHILNGLKTMQMPATAKEFLDTAIAVSSSVSIGLLDVQFQDNDTYMALENALIQFDWIVDNDMYYERSQTVFRYYVLIMKLVSNYEKIQHGVEAGFHILGQRIERIESKQKLMLSEDYINFFEQVCSYYSQLGFELETKFCELRMFMKTNAHMLTCLKSCYIRLFIQTKADLSTCLKREHCTFDKVGLSYYKLGEYHIAAGLLELALKTDPEMNTMDKAHVLLYLIKSYSNLKDHELVLQTTNKLHKLHDSIMNITASEYFWHTNTVANLLIVYEEQGFVSEARALFQNILGYVNEGWKIQGSDLQNVSQVLTFRNVYNMLQEFFNNEDYEKVIKIATHVIDTTNNVEAAQPGVLSNKLKLQLIIGKAKFHAKNYSDGLEDIERVLETILSLPNEMFDAEDKVNACWELFPRIVYAEACYNLKTTAFQALIHINVLFFRYSVFFFFDPTLHRVTISAPIIINYLQELSTSFDTELACTTAEFNGFHYIFQTDIYVMWQRMMDLSKSTMLIIFRTLLYLCVLLLQLMILISKYVNKFCILDILICWMRLIILYSMYPYKRDCYLFTVFITEISVTGLVIVALVCVLCQTLLALVIAPRKSGTHLLTLPSVIVETLCMARDPRFKYGNFCHTQLFHLIVMIIYVEVILHFIQTLLSV